MTYYLFAELRSAGDRTLRIHFGELHHLEIWAAVRAVLNFKNAQCVVFSSLME